jgi:hypothetical protein
VGDDEVGPDVRAIFQRLVHAAGVRDGGFEPGGDPTAFTDGPAGRAVDDFGDPVRRAVVVPRRGERAPPAVPR